MLTVLVLGYLLSNQAGSPQSARLQDRGEITAKSFVAPGREGPARGDGRADDTEALQAAVDYAVEHRTALRLEPGTYRISRTLEIESPIATAPYGFKIIGSSGPNRSGSVQRGGVAIVLARNATDQTAVVRLGHADFLDLEISNLSLLSEVPGNATRYGLLFAGTRFSHAMLSNVAVGSVDTAFGVVPGGSGEGNGEGVDMTGCSGNYVNCFYSNSSGQAYCHRMVSCMASIMNGGTCFRFGSGNLGFSIDVFGMMSTLLSGPKRNTYLENDGVSGCINFVGGRAEHVDTVLAYIGGSYNDTGIVTVRGMEFTDYSGRFPFLDATLNHAGNGQWTNSFEDCKFGADRGAPELTLAPQPSDLSENIFSRCVFQGFGNKLGGQAARSMGIRLRDCRADSPNDHRLVDLSG